MEQFELIVVTLNCTAAQQAKGYLQQTSAQVVMLQELRLDQLGCDDMGAWRAPRGWRMLAAPAC